MSLPADDPSARLDDCRRQIDEIDARITEMLNERARVVEVIGRVKEQFSMKVYEPKREEQVMANVEAHNRGPLSSGALRRVYERIMDEMRTLQRDQMASDGRTGTDKP